MSCAWSQPAGCGQPGGKGGESRQHLPSHIALCKEAGMAQLLLPSSGSTYLHCSHLSLATLSSLLTNGPVQPALANGGVLSLALLRGEMFDFVKT